MSEILGWWFTAADKLPNGDNRRVIIGETLSVDPPIIPCRHGLHASVDPFDALQYAPGPILYRVRLAGEIVAHENDKYAASKRTAIARYDATEMLQEYARKVALSVAHLWDMPVVVREFLETGDKSKAYAAYAAYAARAADAAAYAARAADAAHAAVHAADAAADATASAAYAARAAASAAYAARAAARAADAANRKLFNEMVSTLTGDN